MAIKYQDIKTKLETDPLTEKEFELIQQAEDHIDAEIQAKFGKVYYEVGIDKAIVRFDWSPVTMKSIDSRAPRRTAMQRELEKRYQRAGWSLNWGEMDDNYVIFKGK